MKFIRKIIRIIIARIKCRLDNGEWTKHYCTNDCSTCGYGKRSIKGE